MATGLTGYRTFYMTIRIRDEASRGAANVVGALKSVGDEAEAASNKMLAVLLWTLVDRLLMRLPK